MSLLRKLKHTPAVRYFYNCWRFRKELSNFYDWDNSSGIALYSKAVSIVTDYIEHNGCCIIKQKQVRNGRELSRLLLECENVPWSKYLYSLCEEKDRYRITIEKDDCTIWDYGSVPEGIERKIKKEMDKCERDYKDKMELLLKRFKWCYNKLWD